MKAQLRNKLMRISAFVFVVLSAGFMCGCGKSDSNAANSKAQSSADASVFISVISDMDSNPQAVDMAMKLAGFSLDEGRNVFMFFNVKGVRVPVQSLGDDVAFGSNDPIKKQLAKLIERGATVHVCPICMKALDVNEDQLVAGSHVTTRPALFQQIRGDTCVFTY